MHITGERFRSAIQPLGEPLPLVTDGQRDHDGTYAGGVRMLGHAVDSTVTALVRPFAAPVLAAKGAARKAKAKPNANALKTTGAAVLGVGTGTFVGLAGGAAALGEAVLFDTVGAICLMSLLTCGHAVSGAVAATRIVFGFDR